MLNRTIVCALSMSCMIFGVDKGKTKGVHKQRVSVYKGRHKRRSQKGARLKRPCTFVDQELRLLTLTRGKQTPAQLVKVEGLLARGVNPNMRRTRDAGAHFDSLPIGNAALYGNAALTELLLYYGADPTATFKLGKHWTQALHCAVRERGANNVTPGDYTKIIYALVERGANPSAGGNEKLPFTPLHMLAMQKRMRWAVQKELALALFASEALECKESYDGRMPIQVAKRTGLRKLAQLFDARQQEVADDEALKSQFIEAFLTGDMRRAASFVEQVSPQMVLPRKLAHIQHIFED